jgi:hypothetical protein
MRHKNAERRKLYKEAFEADPDNIHSVNMADLLYGEYWPKRGKWKALLDELDLVGLVAHNRLHVNIAHRKVGKINIDTAFIWSESVQGPTFWSLLNAASELCTGNLRKENFSYFEPV